MFSDLIKYNHCANQAFIEQFLATEKEIPKAEKLFSHILNAQHVWISRINRKQPLFSIWDTQPKDKFVDLEDEQFAGFQHILKEGDFLLPIYYKTVLGEFTSTVSEILFHAFNHATYHRGQIAAIFKENEITPPVTDFIFLKWQGKL